MFNFKVFTSVNLGPYHGRRPVLPGSTRLKKRYFQRRCGSTSRLVTTPRSARLSLVDLRTLAHSLESDRRGAQRHPVQVELRFERRGSDGAVRVGHGKAEDVSRGGLRFRAEEPLEVGAEVTTRIAWPVLLQNVCDLELVLKGSVSRVTERGTILQIRSYEFRTCGSRSFCEPPELSSNWIVA